MNGNVTHRDFSILNPSLCRTPSGPEVVIVLRRSYCTVCTINLWTAINNTCSAKYSCSDVIPVWSLLMFTNVNITLLALTNKFGWCNDDIDVTLFPDLRGRGWVNSYDLVGRPLVYSVVTEKHNNDIIIFTSSVSHTGPFSSNHLIVHGNLLSCSFLLLLNHSCT